MHLVGSTIDFDECDSAANNTCEQECINTEGSYYCACYQGYQFIEGSDTNCEG